MLHQPVITVLLKDFEKPFFIAAGQVGHPGKYELRSDTTLIAALAIAGDITTAAKHSQVVLFRHISSETVEARVFNVKQMLASRNLGRRPSPATRRPGVRATKQDLKDSALLAYDEHGRIPEPRNILRRTI